MTDAVIIAAITAIGGIVTAYLKISGDKRENFIKKELTDKSQALEAVAKQARVQNEFNSEMTKALVRIEQKVDDASREAGVQMSGALSKLESTVGELDKKSNMIVTGIAVLQANKGS